MFCFAGHKIKNGTRKTRNDSFRSTIHHRHRRMDEIVHNSNGQRKASSPDEWTMTNSSRQKWRKILFSYFPSSYEKKYRESSAIILYGLQEWRGRRQTKTRSSCGYEVGFDAIHEKSRWEGKRENPREAAKQNNAPGLLPLSFFSLRNSNLNLIFLKNKSWKTKKDGHEENVRLVDCNATMTTTHVLLGSGIACTHLATRFVTMSTTRAELFIISPSAE